MTNLAWDDALWALAALTADPQGLKGIWVKCPLGPVRQEWLAWLEALHPNRSKIPASIDTERLLGGLDLAMTLQTGRSVRQKGVLAHQAAHLLVCPMAERMPPLTSSILSQALDTGQVASHHGHESQEAKIGLVAMDESTPDEDLMSRSLCEQLSIWLDLNWINPNVNASDETLDMLERVEKKLHVDVDSYREGISNFQLNEDHIRQICELSKGFGIQSLRAPLFAIRLAMVFALLKDSSTIEDEDLGRAARLVLTPRATTLPQEESNPADQQHKEEREPSSPPQDQDSSPPPSDADLQEASKDDAPPPITDPDPKESEVQELESTILDSALATLPAGLLSQLAAGQAQIKKGAGGRAGALLRGMKKGRPLPAIKAMPQNGSRLHILATLRHAAPRQTLRGNATFLEKSSTTERNLASQGIKILSEDFHIQRFATRSESCIIFCIDASGSSALERLAEAKGAVELLLKDSYARRDHICVIGFRDKNAQLHLPATRSLVRAKRQLQALPAGGGTPLASALQLALETALQANHHGMSPTLVILSDGRANVTLQGEGSRPIAKSQALALAKQWRAKALRGIWLDTSSRPDPNAHEIALAMGAHYVPLPHANSQKLATAVLNVQTNLK
jgi:magnesium chelatase subunit D